MVTILTILDESKNKMALKKEEKCLLEGPISYTESHHALRSMKNNKSPGPDGYTCEFFKFFYKDIGEFLVRSLNYSFQDGQMSVTPKQSYYLHSKRRETETFLKELASYFFVKYLIQNRIHLYCKQNQTSYP